MLVKPSRSVPTAVKRSVLARDGLTCRHCGIAVSPRGAGPSRPDELHYDHVKPWGDGGNHTLDNLVVSCRTCNLTRDKPVASIRQDLISFHHGRYWWTEGVHPPRIADDSRVLVDLREHATRRYRPVGFFVSRIMRGMYAATDDGGPIYMDDGYIA